MISIYENSRTAKIKFTFTGEIGKGANDSLCVLDNIPIINKGEFIYDAFCRVTTPLTSQSTSDTYLQCGIAVDSEDSAINSVSGIVDTLNASPLGLKFVPNFIKSSIDGRNIELVPKGTSDITSGAIEIILIIMRADIDEEACTQKYIEDNYEAPSPFIPPSE